MKNILLKTFLLSTGLSFAACYSGGQPMQGLAPTPDENQGPNIEWDVFAEPVPEIPFPNNIASRPSNKTLTGRLLNIPMNAETAHENKLRGQINTLDGFGVYAPITIPFDGLIDLADLHARQNDSDATNDAIYLVNLNPNSSEYGQAALLDVGGGRFPLGLEETDSYFLNDPRSENSNLFFETVDEDINANGVLDYGEDTDGDGVLDKPNLWGTYLDDTSRLHTYKDLIHFYELETDTLMIRNVMPLEEQSDYAVILTNHLVGKENGSTVRSPFTSINHSQQTGPLQPLIEDGLLTNLGLSLNDIAFAWTYTTQSITPMLERLRAGLYGEGPFAYLNSEFPARIAQNYQIEYKERTSNPYILATNRLIEALSNQIFLDALEIEGVKADMLFDSYRDNIEYFTFFEFDTPLFLADEKDSFDVDPVSGNARYASEKVPVVCAVPKTQNGFEPPFPVHFYGHGYKSAKWEFIGFAGFYGGMGIASCTLDAYGHGLPTSAIYQSIGQSILEPADLDILADILFNGRSRDLNNDGATDPGGDFWGADSFHTRDVLRQTIVDYFQTLRVFTSFGKTTMPVDVNDDGQDEIAGDFNGDGVADIGGSVDYHMFGQSLGGILTALVAPLEANVTSAVPSAGGGGLVDVGMRTTQGGAVQAVFMPAMGPIIAGRKSSTTDGGIDIVYHILDVNDDTQLRVATVPDIAQGRNEVIELGDRIVVTNLSNGEMDSTVVQEASGNNPAGLFRTSVPADKYDLMQIDLYRENGTTPYRTISTFEREVDFQAEAFDIGAPLKFLQDGFGLKRNTPDFRRLFNVAAMVLDAADPMNFMQYHQNPLDMRPEGKVGTNVLVMNTVGDMNVPINTGIALGRSGGLFKVHQKDLTYGKTHDQLLLDTWMVEGLEHLKRFEDDPCYYDERAVLFDIDNASEGADSTRGPHIT
ncbi:MAG: hypothetical protein QGI45_13580, partial [Myxococcota bacterium]|nr:hypothetical protein [Myxococcota bacterium]